MNKDRKNYKIALLIFYFGSFPAFFSHFLTSCQRNPEITWLIYTDQEKLGDWPENVQYFSMTFAQCREIFQKKFDFPIALTGPKKLCDFKPAYGYVMEEYLQKYDYWGYSDLDIIWGKAWEFLPENLAMYDKLYTLGHFTLYRNNPDVNRWFMNYDGGKRVQEVFSTIHMKGFDEWGSNNINQIFAASGYSTLDTEFGADVWPEQTDLWLAGIDKDHKFYHKISGSNGIFHLVQGGHLYWCGSDGNRTEYPYIHLQKRFLKNECRTNFENGYIVPGAFLPDAWDEQELVEKYSKRYLLDRQYFRIKWYNLKRHLILFFCGR